MNWVWIAASLVLALMVPMTAANAAYAERRLLWRYGPIGEWGFDSGSLTSYHEATFDLNLDRRLAGTAAIRIGVVTRSPYHESLDRQAESTGFRPLAALRDITSELYRLRYEFWLSDNRETLLLVGAGSLMGHSIEAVMLYTVLADGRAIVSTNSQVAMEVIPGDLWVWKLLIGANLADLVAWHRGRVANAGVAVRLFAGTTGQVMGQFRDSGRARLASLRDRGLAQLHDVRGESWSYSTRGALILAYWTYSRGIYDAISQPFRKTTGRLLAGAAVRS